MKAAVLLTLSFLLSAFTTNLPLAFSQDAQQVHDFQGVPLSPARKYVIAPAVATGGGVGLGIAGNQECPVTLLQDFSETFPGLPVRFTIKGTGGAILTGTPLGISFVDKPACASSSNWVAVADSYAGKWLGIGGAQDHPGSKQIISGTFNIQKYDLGYKLVFCPAIGGPCSDIGRDEDENGWRLVLTNAGPFTFRFVNRS